MKHTSRDTRVSQSHSPAAGPGNVSRRRFLQRSASVAAALSLNHLFPGSAAAAKKLKKDKELPKPKASGIEHVVVVMMENRSFDHLLGWLPDAEGIPPGLTYPDRAGVPRAVWHLGEDYQGCAYSDPDHSYAGGRVEYNNGQCDGWLKAGTNDLYAIGYYNRPNLPFLGQAAPAWTTCDRYFTSIMAGTFANRIYQHAAQTDRLANDLLPICALPTIWDRLAAAQVSAKYYFSDFPFLALWGSKYLGISRPTRAFLDDCAAGTLPAVSFVEPRFLGEAQGFSNDYHPHSDIRKGEAFLNTLYEAVISSPNWSSTILVINFDEWGGFFDHVPPPLAPIPPADAALDSDGRLGFRVPALVISPWSSRATVAGETFDHTSILKMIEWRWELQPLTVRDASANNLAHVLDFDTPNLLAPHFSVPVGPFPQLCISGTIIDREVVLAEFARLLGF